jgi:hypothetical protein
LLLLPATLRVALRVMMAKITVAGQIEEQIRALQKSLFSHLFTGSTIAMAFPAIERD